MEHQIEQQGLQRLLSLIKYYCQNSIKIIINKDAKLLPYAVHLRIVKIEMKYPDTIFIQTLKILLTVAIIFKNTKTKK